MMVLMGHGGPNVSSTVAEISRKKVCSLVSDRTPDAAENAGEVLEDGRG
jgi:hypothetical protein